MLKVRLIVFSMVIAVIALLTGSAPNPKANVVTKDVSYSAGGVQLKGYLAYDESTDKKRPGILVVPEWWGLNDYPKMRARQLAELGYVAMAIDMYGNGKVVTTPDSAGQMAQAAMQDKEAFQARFAAALKELAQQPSVDTSKLGAIGYCFGGGVVLRAARLGFPLDGVVSFHGTLGTSEPATRGQVKAQMLVLNGAADPMNPPKTVSAFKKEMDAAGAKYRVVNYPGAKHAFTNPAADSVGRKYNMPIAYNKSADQKSWRAMQDFFAKLWKQ